MLTGNRTSCIEMCRCSDLWFSTTQSRPIYNVDDLKISVCRRFESGVKADINPYQPHRNTIREFNVEWKAECGQLNLTRVTKNKRYIKRKKLKQTNAASLSLQNLCDCHWFIKGNTDRRQCQDSPVQVRDPWRQQKWNQKDARTSIAKYT